MAYVRIVSKKDWNIIRKYLDDETMEGTAILIAEDVAKATGIQVLDRKIVSNPREDDDHDISLYLIGNPNNLLIDELLIEKSEVDEL